MITVVNSKEWKSKTMKLHELLHENDNVEFARFLKEIERILGGELRSEEIKLAHMEWQESEISPDEMADMIEANRVEEVSPGDDINSFGDDFEGDDYTDYSMRQGEMGFPDRQR